MRRNKTLALLLSVFFVLAVVWGIFIPPYENLDEIEHAEVIRHVVVTGKLPVHGQAEAAGFAVRQEASQPPLYYWLASLWARAWQLPLDPPNMRPVPSGMVSCGPDDTFYNRATWARQPYQEAGPWQGNRLWLHGLRFFSTLLQLATVAGTWALARRLFPQGVVPLVTTAIVAFNPQFLLVASGVNNDNLVTPLATWGLVVMLDIWQQGIDSRRLLLLGCLSGLAALSKLSGLALVGMGGLVVLLRAWRDRLALGRLWGAGVLLGGTAALLVAPWLLYNFRTYGDWTALAPMLERVGRRDFGIDWLGEARLMFLSYWGQMPCAFYPGAFYWFYSGLTAGGGIGLVLGWRSFSEKQRWGIGLVGCWFALVVAAWCRWTLITPASGGRLLFPAAPALALMLAAGWDAWGRRSGFLLRVVRGVGALAVFWGWAGLLVGPLFLFVPPPLLLSQAEFPNAVDLTFGDEIRVRGYTARLVAPSWTCGLFSPAYCNMALETTLYWEPLRALDQDRVLILQLRSAKPGDTTLRMGYNRWPGRGNLPTSAAMPGRVVVDRYRFPLSPADFPTQAWDLQVAWTDESLKTALPVQSQGVAVGEAARLTTLRVPGEVPLCESKTALTAPVVFGDALVLTHAGAEPEGDHWRVSLCWEARGGVADDYTVFVHAYDGAGELMGTGDGPPMGNAFPTHLWGADDRVLDVHSLSLPAGEVPARIVVGLYNPSTMTRMPGSHEGVRLPDDAFEIHR